MSNKLLNKSADHDVPPSIGSNSLQGTISNDYLPIRQDS